MIYVTVDWAYGVNMDCTWQEDKNINKKEVVRNKELYY